MNPYILPERSEWPSLMRRPAMDIASLETVVDSILRAVKEEGDVAVKRYTHQFDQAEITVLAVSEAEFLAAEQTLEEDLKAAIRLAKDNIERFHIRQHDTVEVIETMPGVRCWRKSMPIEKVGLYIPGGTAPLFSTVLMLGIPAALAGCNEVVLCSPPQTDGSIHPAILYAARLAGIRSVFKAGGVQAIGAMAYGTESIPAVYKIFGPGNQYVTCAKQLVQHSGVSIDLPAGPSEVLVCADHTANPEFVAADLLSQAEHGADSQVVLVAFEETFVQQVLAAIERQLESLPRRDIAQAAMANSVAVVLKNRSDATDFINAYAPEHLILSVEDATAFSAGIANAGSVFLGHYTPESVGDYASGTNHTLPTNGFARTYSGVSLDSFVKKITFQEITREGLELLGPAVMCMAEAEALVGHSRAVGVRIGL
ncbi:MAG: histidinol dehydrogenase [Saprospiraceae bacterium]|nr:histidinol dehydrogenase [Saprospiraceae bacterium]MDZ4703543.1 histidinol dehydrogenase [Saprospiraceae bacterium]